MSTATAIFDEYAEACVIGCLLNDEQIIPAVLEILDETAFYKAAHRILYNAIAELFKENKPISVLSVGELIAKRGLWGRIGEVEGMWKPYQEARSLLESSPSPENVSYYAEIVKEKATRRKLIEISKHVKSMSEDGNQELAEILDRTAELLFDATLDKRRNGFKLNNELAKIIARAKGEIAQREKYFSGYENVDTLTGGLESGEVMIIAGRPGIGKSTLAHNIALYLLLEKEIAVTYFLYEMSKEQLLTRMISTISQVPFRRIESEPLTREEVERIERATCKLENKPLKIFDRPLHIEEARTAVRSTQNEFGNEQMIVIIDYVQLIPVSTKQETLSEYEVVTRASRKVKNQIAQALMLPVILVSQLSRKSESRSNPRPTLDCLRGSGALEEDAAIALMLHRPGFYDEGTLDDEIEVLVRKARHGERGEVKLGWDGRIFKISS